MPLSLRTAAQQAGVSKSTILRAIKSGRLSAVRTADMGYDIDPAELFRVYPPAQSSNGAMGQAAPVQGNSTTSDAPLAAEIAGLREILRRADAQADELRQDRDRWRNMAEQAQRLLTDQRPQLSWWKRLTG